MYFLPLIIAACTPLQLEDHDVEEFPNIGDTNTDAIDSDSDTTNEDTPNPQVTIQFIECSEVAGFSATSQPLNVSLFNDRHPVVSTTSGVLYFENQGGQDCDIRFTEKSAELHLPQNSFINQTVALDYNNDGTNDLVVLSDDHWELFEKTPSHFTSITSQMGISPYTDATMIGSKLLIGSEDRIYSYDDFDHFELPDIFAWHGMTHSLVSDFDHNGFDDLLVSPYEGTLIQYRQTALNDFQPADEFIQYSDNDSFHITEDHFVTDLALSSQIPGLVAATSAFYDGLVELYSSNSDGTFNEIGLSANLKSAGDRTSIQFGQIHPALNPALLICGARTNDLLMMRDFTDPTNPAYYDYSELAGVHGTQSYTKCLFADLDQDGDDDIIKVSYEENQNGIFKLFMNTSSL